MPTIIISNNEKDLKTELNKFNRTATVEAEFGDTCVTGSEVTLAHHGPRSGELCPCLYNETHVVEAIGLSHVDLDTMGGILAICGIKPQNNEFWELAAYVDINGPHKMSEASASDETIRQLYAVWAWQQDHRDDLDTRPPKEGGVLYLSLGDFLPWRNMLHSVLTGDEDLLQAGDEFKKDEEELNSSTFFQEDAGIVVRFSETFTNHLYVTPNGVICRSVVTYNTKYHSITVSLADPIRNFSVEKFLQGIFGMEAGGRDVIGGSPRNLKATQKDLWEVVHELKAQLPAG